MHFPCPALSTRQTGQIDSCVVIRMDRQCSMLDRTRWQRKAAACVLALGLTLISVTVPFWSNGSHETELSISNQFSEQSIHRREEILAQKLYSAEEQEAKVSIHDFTFADSMMSHTEFCSLCQSGFSSKTQEKRVQTLELEASKLSQELSKINGDSLLFGSSFGPASSSRPARTQQLAQLDRMRSDDNMPGQPDSSAIHFHLDGENKAVKSTLSSIADSVSHSSQPPVINIYVGDSADAIRSIAAPTSAAAVKGEKNLIKLLEAKMLVQDREIARLLAARRIPNALHSAGGPEGARTQSLSELSPASSRLHIGRIEAEIGRTLDELTQAHQRLQVDTAQFSNLILALPIERMSLFHFALAFVWFTWVWIAG